MMPEKHKIHPAFAEDMEKLLNLHFRRNSDAWPVYRDPALSSLIESRRNNRFAPAERLAAYPNGEALHQELLTSKSIPKDMNHSSEVNDLLLFAATLSKNWEDPASVENVITTPSDPAIMGSILGSVANANLVYSEYAGMAENLESMVIRQMAELAGYDPQQATGIFTQGGTFCNLYGYLLGIRKSLPMAREYGLEHGQDYRILNSRGGHYSNITNLSLLGVNLRRKVIRIRINASNEMDVIDLEEQLRSCFKLGCVVPTIMLTMGTTDTFGVDRVLPVVEIRDRLCAEFEIKVKPHIHVDSAIGWPLIFFRGYDFEANPLRINAATLPSLRRYIERFKELQYADSFTIDFQKWGYVPYTSSLVMIRNKQDLDALAHDPENFTYFDRDVEGQGHLHSTIECSRGATGVFAAANSLMQLGIDGYRRLIANSLQNANYFRFRLSCLPGVVLAAQQNQGPSVGFRIYDPTKVADPDEEFRHEQAVADTRTARNSQYHRENFLSRGKHGLYTNWIEALALGSYDQLGRASNIPGEKAVFMNPHCNYHQIDLFIERLRNSMNA
jgi:glutamate/tyrosine decarboxylase-like PLP-dependent enzyme